MGYVDDDYAKDIDFRRPMIDCVFMFVGGPICQKSTLQDTVAQFTTEAEYMALETIKQQFGLDDWLESQVSSKTKWCCIVIVECNLLGEESSMSSISRKNKSY